MGSLIDLLQEIGLTEKEALTYLISLKIGANPASVIAKHSEINRCTSYSILESLVSKGLMSEIEKDNVRFFNALPPENLLTYIDEKRRDLINFKSEIETQLTHFKSLENKAQVKPHLQSYTGAAGLLQVYNSAIQEKNLCIFSIQAGKQHEFFNRFAVEYLKNFRSIKIIKYSNGNIKKYEINTPDSLKDIESLQPIELITNSKVYVISSNDTYAVEIINPAITRFFKNKFDILWKNKRASSV
jgi:sugar-specific transcriptional regulator TrmB